MPKAVATPLQKTDNKPGLNPNVPLGKGVK